MTDSAQLYFQGYNIRELKEPAVSREVFIGRCLDQVKNAEKKFQEMLLEEKPNATQEEIERARYRGKLTAYRALGRQSTFFLAVFILKQKWLNSDYNYMLCSEVDKNKWNINLWVLAREHLKSMIITGISTIREIVADPNMTFCLLSNTPDTAKAFLKTITDFIDTDAPGPKFLRYLYSDVFWDNPRQGYETLDDGTRKTWTWNTKQITVKRTQDRKEPTIGTAGIEGGSITGYHYGALIFDDAETEDSVTTAESIERLTNKITNLFNAGQTDNLKFVMIGTFYAREDVYCRLLKQGICKSAIVQPCFREDGSPVYGPTVIDRKKITANGEEKIVEKTVGYTKEKLVDKISKMTPVVAATQMFCDPSMSNSNVFQAEHIHYWPAENLKNLSIYTIVDPAGTPTNKSDYTAMITGGVNCDGHILIIDIINDKMTLDQKFANLLLIYKRYKPKIVWYERVGMQADIDYHLNKMKETNWYFPIQEYVTTQNKVNKISALIPKMKCGELHWPERCLHMNWQGEMKDMCQQVIIDQLLPFPNASHDDAIDAIATFNDLNERHMLELPHDPHERLVSSARGSYIDVDYYDPMQSAYDRLSS